MGEGGGERGGEGHVETVIQGEVGGSRGEGG